jgi:hypothetical protein
LSSDILVATGLMAAATKNAHHSQTGTADGSAARKESEVGLYFPFFPHGRGSVSGSGSDALSFTQRPTTNRSSSSSSSSSSSEQLAAAAASSSEQRAVHRAASRLAVTLASETRASCASLFSWESIYLFSFIIHNFFVLWGMVTNPALPLESKRSRLTDNRAAGRGYHA